MRNTHSNPFSGWEGVAEKVPHGNFYIIPKIIITDFKNPCLNVSHPLFKPPCVLPLRAMTLLAGFMMALSAEMGLRMGVLGSLMSMITTWACSPTFSRMQMNLSDSIVRVLNPIFAGFMPRFWSCKVDRQDVSILDTALVLSTIHEMWKPL